jgi:hypothetical protein
MNDERMLFSMIHSGKAFINLEILLNSFMSFKFD